MTPIDHITVISYSVAFSVTFYFIVLYTLKAFIKPKFDDIDESLDQIFMQYETLIKDGDSLILMSPDKSVYQVKIQKEKETSNKLDKIDKIFI